MVTPERWFEIHFVISVVAFFLLIVSIPIYAGNDDLTRGAGVVAGFLIATALACALGIGYAHWKRDKRAVACIAAVLAAAHIGLTSTMIAEWSMDDCEERVFAPCLGGTVNPLLVFLVDLLVQLVFVAEYVMLWQWKNDLIAAEFAARRSVVTASGGAWEEGTETDITVVTTTEEEEGNPRFR